MSEEAVTTSWFSRLGSAFRGVVIGFVMVLGAIILLWWNEGRSVRRYKEISFAKDNVQEANLDAVNASLEGKLVHFAGAAKTTESLSDDDFGVQVKDSFSMRRVVEMYQWKEIEHRETGKTKKNVGGSTTKEPDKVTYTYEKGWSSSVQNSDTFKQKVDPQTNEERKNPTVIPFQGISKSVSNVTVGAYTLPAGQASSLGSSQKLDVDFEAVKNNLPKSAIVADGAIYFNVYGEEAYNKAMGANAAVATPVTAPAEVAPAHHQPAPEAAAQTAVQNVVADTQAAAQTAVQNAVADTQAAAQTAVQNAVADTQAAAQTAVQNVVADTQAAAQTAVQNVVADTQAAAQTAVQNAVADTQAAAQTAVQNAVANTQPVAQTAVENTVANTQAAAQTPVVEAGAVNVVAYQANPSNPKIGDIRIKYENSPVCDVTVIAKQVGNAVERYKIDEDLSYMDIRNGNLAAKDVFASNEQSESMMVWLLRIVGFGLMAAGFNAIFKPLSVLADVLPFLGNIAEAGCGIISKLLAFGLSLLVIAVAWLFYRPLLAIGLFILMGAAIFGIITLMSKAKAAKAAAPAAPAAEPAPETPAAN